MPTAREKACQHYRDEDIRILQAITPEGGERPTYVEALVRGWRETHRIHLENGVWTCSCDLAKRDCAHRAAVQMVCGCTSSASKPSSSNKRSRGGSHVR